MVLALLSCLFSSEPIQHVPFIVYGTYGAWIYLRYFQRKPEAGFKGDSSTEFSFATFFPGFLQYCSTSCFLFFLSFHLIAIFILLQPHLLGSCFKLVSLGGQYIASFYEVVSGYSSVSVNQ